MLKERISVTPVVDVKERREDTSTGQPPGGFQAPAELMDPENQMASQNRGIMDN